jgi:hypothetical protein
MHRETGRIVVSGRLNGMPSWARLHLSMLARVCTCWPPVHETCLESSDQRDADVLRIFMRRAFWYATQKRCHLSGRHKRGRGCSRGTVCKQLHAMPWLERPTVYRRGFLFIRCVGALAESSWLTDSAQHCCCRGLSERCKSHTVRSRCGGYQTTTINGTLNALHRATAIACTPPSATEP